MATPSSQKRHKPADATYLLPYAKPASLQSDLLHFYARIEYATDDNVPRVFSLLEVRRSIGDGVHLSAPLLPLDQTVSFAEAFSEFLLWIDPALCHTLKVRTDVHNLIPQGATDDIANMVVVMGGASSDTEHGAHFYRWGLQWAKLKTFCNPNDVEL